MRCLALLAVLFLAACGAPQSAAPVSGDATESLRAADAAFAAMAAEEGVAAAFTAYAAEDAVLLIGGAEPVKGRAAIGEIYAAWPDDGALTWTPERAEASGDIGYTWGRYVSTSGDGSVEHGKYVTVWRRDPGGAWRFVADIGNTNPPPQN